MRPAEVVYIGFGSNLGDPEANFRRAKEQLQATPGIEVLRCSAAREYPAMGPPQPDYLNAVIEIRTRLEPEGLLSALQGIEKDMGRTRDLRCGPRTVDLDILFWQDRIVDTEKLSIPHRGASERLFVLEPLAELAPGLVDPRSRRTISQILASLRSQRANA
jgi:2-amino-4-hydroxy-6-hydroxymethyldihydropteridine diphosphokinase